MRIESVSEKPDRAGRYYIRFDGGGTMRLYRQTVEDFGLYPGAELTDAQMEALRASASQMSAKMRAVRIVSSTSISQDELERRLVQKGEDPEQAHTAVQWMAELALVDDRETARQIAARCASHGYGIARAKQALYEKRIPREYWEEALADYPSQDAAIDDFLRARLGTSWDARNLKRATDALLRRGHGYAEIRSALKRLEADVEFLEE